jgi:4-amino-4-deoxy-L-arabinose transferase-like glycosyltransferase
MYSMTLPQLILNALAGAMLALAFFLTARMRLRSMLAMFAWQSSVLALFAATSAVAREDPLKPNQTALTAITLWLFGPSHRFQLRNHRIREIFCRDRGMEPRHQQ